MALPLFILGASVIRAATPAIARYLARQGLKQATGAAAKKTDKKSALGAKGQRTIIAIGSLAPMVPRGEGTKVNASKSTTGGMSAQSEARRKIAKAEAKEKRLQADSKRSKAVSTAAMEKELAKKALKARSAISKTNKSKSSASKLSKFEQAFADARKEGKKTFKFTNRAGNTNTYTTERKDKKPLPKKKG